MSTVEAYGNLPPSGLPQILQELNSASIIGVDTETISIKDKSLIGLALAPNPNYAVWFQLGSPYFHIVLSILRNPKITKVLYNSKFDFQALEPLQIDESNFEDSMILAYTLNLPLKLYELASHLKHPVPDKFYFFSISKNGTMLDTWNADPNFVIQKCCLDASLALYCWYKLLPSITESYYIDHNIVHILRHMEKVGVKLDTDLVTKLSSELETQTSFLRQFIQTTEGCDPNSNRQVGIILAQKGWRLPYTKSKRQLKVDEKTLREVPDPLAQLVLTYRGKAKLKSTYVNPLLNLPRAYTHYNNTSVITGRLSSSDPINMQNIPDSLRAIFLPDQGSVLWSYDANQIELRVLAYLAQDKVMMKAFADGADIHKETMDRMGLNTMSNSIQARKLAKVLNFTTVYLGGEQTLVASARKEGINITRAEAADFQARYSQTYTGVRDYIQNQRDQIMKYGYVTTLYGRIRKAEPYRMGTPKLQEETIRELFNMPIQGTAAEITKKMMARANGYDLRIQVHDELVYNKTCPPLNLFENVAPFQTPLALKVGLNWGNLKEVK